VAATSSPSDGERLTFGQLRQITPACAGRYLARAIQPCCDYARCDNNRKGRTVNVLSIDQAAARAGIVRRTLERLISVGDGPSTVQLSKRRIGILEDDLEAWLLSRRRPAPGSTKVA